ncbi:hypothetical protein [Vibrio variabilis]|nr:hypothetical protein [Vibrio variabilis]
MEKNRRLHLLGLMFDGIASGMMLMALHDSLSNREQTERFWPS